MRGEGGWLALAPRLAWAFPAAFLCLLLPARIGAAAGLGTGAAGVATTVVLFALPLLYTVPAGRVLWDRYTWWLLATQVVLTYLPFVAFGQKWAVGLSGLLGGLLLLTLPARVSWVLFIALVALEAVLRLGVFGVYPEGGAQFISWVFIVPVDMALPLYGLVRLSDLVTELHAARTELAALAVTRERVQAVARLRAAIGGGLDVVTTRAADALATLSDSPDRARAHLSEAAGIARRAAERIRQTVVLEQVDRGEVPARAGRTVAPRLALLVLVVDLTVYAGHHVVIVTDEFAGRAAKAAGVFAIAAIAALQLYHSLTQRAGARPPKWRLTLSLQLLLPFVAIVATFDDLGTSLVGLVAFPAGSVLLLLRGRSAWLVFALVAASVGVPRAVWQAGELDVTVYFIGLVASTGLAVYGLSRLTALAEELEAARHDLARTAVDRERLRVAQDTHDLLGLGLSAVALKCDLASRLIGRDDARARSELDALLRLARQTRADIQAVSTGEQGLSSRTELATAREVLASAGVAVEVRVATPDRALPQHIDAVLATVLREAVTNVLRHAEATRCEIDLIAAGDAVSLRIVNDGATGDAPNPRAGGRGVANLTARAEALGGHLAQRTDADRFTLTVQIPLSAGSARPDVEDAPTPSDSAHSVDKVVGRAVLEEQP
jgi:two-component system, NarL family, sensor histidine kinase DesK